ncbi:MAG: hypothetical protein RMJ44_01935 [Cytophagales bacterium]|nr:hypothetical protein [Bernardetiaceae bacterium]MDW8209822.1 hypothetical protein [Cytophagales bacterium]
MKKLSLQLGLWGWLAISTALGQVAMIPDSLEAKGKFHQNKRTGVWKFYFPSTKELFIEGSFHNHVPEGKWWWYRRGKVFFEISFRKGLPEGWGKWYAEGKLVYQQWFQKGRASGAFAYYNPSGHYALRGAVEENRHRGTWQVFFPDGKLAAEWNCYKQGVYHGEAKWFLPDGTPYAKGNFLTALAEGRWEFNWSPKNWYLIGHFKDGKPHGLWQIYHQQQLLHQLSFKEGMPDKDHLHYDLAGNIIEKVQYDSGKVISWESKYSLQESLKRENRIFLDDYGKPIAEGTYQNGLLEGQFTYWGALGETLTIHYLQGQLASFAELQQKGKALAKIAYAKDKNMSQCQLFYPDGTIKAQGVLCGNQPSGVWQFFHSNGKLKAQGEFIGGLPSNHWKYYDENQQLQAEGRLQKGCLQGQWSFYHKGVLKAVGNFEEGLRHGLWTDYYAQGGVKAIGKYWYDREDSLWRYFHLNGQESQQEHWYKGKLLEVTDFKAPNGRSLPKGTLKQGNGSRFIYHSRRSWMGKWRLSVEGYYKNGLPEGRWRYYHPKGRLLKELIFVQGKPIDNE